ncbi:hypothetical protein ACJ73_04353 [Blastomyces percursus]|uniref:Non-homologous end-joining factor 1 n=1 Tax=Blastomyces percursus TaxID=1658174 RepID=A0A1J9Q6D0_9EURO|nr:hypothetical protein ACJ73_04353 [Blastomyces percursus]
MPKWSKLQLPSGNPIPRLLYKFISSNQGCEIYVTDLAYVWSQSLTRKEIINKASKYNTSIDPSEDDEQYFVLLQKISDALRGSKGSSLLLVSETEGNELKLNTSTKLPAPLDPLQWTFTLSQQSPNALTKHILLPILKGEVNHETRILSLIGQVKQKDWALSKLFDKIESSGVDLSTVFPGMGGVRLSRKDSVYSQVSKLIKGVAPFDEELWNKEYQAKDADYNLGVHIASELSLSSSSIDRQSDGIAPENWWNKLGAGSADKPRQAATKDKHQEEPASKIPLPPVEREEATESDDDEFQTMKTPPRLKSPRRKMSESNTPHKSTRSTRKRHIESNGDSTEGSPSPSLGSKNRKHIEDVIDHSKQKKSLASNSSEATASEEDKQGDIHLVSKRRPRGLGAICGRQPVRPKTSPMESAESTESEARPEAATKPKPTTKAKGNLGTIGGKKYQEKPRQETPIESTASDVSNAPGTASSLKPTKEAADTNDITESENDTDSSISRPAEQELPKTRQRKSSHPLKAQPKSGGMGVIGQIGGRKKNAEHFSLRDHRETTKLGKLHHDNDEDGDEMETSPAPRQTAKPKHSGGQLGMIGGRGKPGASTSHKEPSLDRKMPESSPPSRCGTASRTTEQPLAPELGEQMEAKQEAKEETPEERANRRRAELRKQLEARNKGVGTGGGGPAKKKRRF